MKKVWVPINTYKDTKVKCKVVGSLTGPTKHYTTDLTSKIVRVVVIPKEGE